MTEKEFARFNRGNELKKDIENLEREIEMIENDSNHLVLLRAVI